MNKLTSLEASLRSKIGHFNKLIKRGQMFQAMEYKTSEKCKSLLGNNI